MAITCCQITARLNWKNAVKRGRLNCHQGFPKLFDVFPDERDVHVIDYLKRVVCQKAFAFRQKKTIHHLISRHYLKHLCDAGYY